MTQNDLMNFMQDLARDQDGQDRQFVVQTGYGGMKLIQNAMQTHVYLDSMKSLNFSREERKRLGEMIKSPDPENFEIARILIDNKREERLKNFIHETD